jgi:hypothetical protein
MFRLGFVYLGRAVGKIFAAVGAHKNKDSALRDLFTPAAGVATGRGVCVA